MHTFKLGDVVIFQHMYNKRSVRKCVIIDKWHGSFDFRLKEINTDITFPAFIAELTLVTEKKNHFPKWW